MFFQLQLKLHLKWSRDHLKPRWMVEFKRSFNRSRKNVYRIGSGLSPLEHQCTLMHVGFSSQNPWLLYDFTISDSRVTEPSKNLPSGIFTFRSQLIWIHSFSRKSSFVQSSLLFVYCKNAKLLSFHSLQTPDDFSSRGVLRNSGGSGIRAWRRTRWGWSSSTTGRSRSSTRQTSPKKRESKLNK